MKKPTKKDLELALKFSCEEVAGYRMTCPIEVNGSDGYGICSEFPNGECYEWDDVLDCKFRGEGTCWMKYFIEKALRGNK